MEPIEAEINELIKNCTYGTKENLKLKISNFASPRTILSELAVLNEGLWSGLNKEILKVRKYGVKSAFFGPKTTPSFRNAHLNFLIVYLKSPYN